MLSPAVVAAQAEFKPADIQCTADTLAFALACGLAPVEGQACPAGGQDLVDALYSSCADDSNAEAGDWQKYADGDYNEMAEACGCSDAAQSAPAVFVLILAAAANHFLN